MSRPDVEVTIQHQPFDTAELKSELLAVSPEAGAVVEFTGLVRGDQLDAGTVTGLFLEHYPGMTEKSLINIIDRAAGQWPLHGVRIVHRVGFLATGEEIVYVAVSSSHRKAALACVDFLMDYLKNDVPIWKKEITADNESWVEQKTTDQEAKKRWE